MLEILLALFSSSGIGSIVGLVGGLANRYADYKFKAKDQEFELLKLREDREYMKEEYAHKIQITSVEANKEIEIAGYEAMEDSYSFARTTREDGFVDQFSKFIRPLLTLLFFFSSLYIFYEVSLLVSQIDVPLSAPEVLSLYKTSIEWILFQAGVAIGWWFAMRPGKLANFGGK